MIYLTIKLNAVLTKCRHGPLLDVSGALWVLLQGLHDLAVVQHQPHQLVLPLRLGHRAVDGPDQLQLLQVLERLRNRQKGKGGQREMVIRGTFTINPMHLINTVCSH